MNLLRDPFPEVRESARKAIRGMLTGEDAIGADVMMRTAEIQELLGSLLVAEGEREVRRSALEVLELLGKDAMIAVGEPVIDGLIEMLSDHNVPMRRRAVLLLAAAPDR